MSRAKRSRYDELAEGARALGEPEIRATLRQLARDPRFAAVVAWLSRYQESWARTVSSQVLAADHGKLAHASGSLHALQLLQGSLRVLLEERKESALSRQSPES